MSPVAKLGNMFQIIPSGVLKKRWRGLKVLHRDLVLEEPHGSSTGLHAPHSVCLLLSHIKQRNVQSQEKILMWSLPPTSVVDNCPQSLESNINLHRRFVPSSSIKIYAMVS